MKIAEHNTVYSFDLRQDGMQGKDKACGDSILLVDDDLERLNETRKFLQNAGYNVIGAASAREANALYDADPFISLVIARVVLNQESGVHVAKHVKESDRGTETLLVSHFSRDLLRYVPGFSEHEHFLANPATDEMLISRVRRLIKKRQ